MAARLGSLILVGSVNLFCGRCTLLPRTHQQRTVKPQFRNPPRYSSQKHEMFKCNHECRWKHGMSKDVVGLTIPGTRPALCRCYRQDERLPNIPTVTEKSFDVNATWSGDKHSGFDSSLVCVETLNGLKTMAKTEAEALTKGGNATMLHCGECASCSSRQDIELLSRSRHWITEVITKVMTSFGAPWGHHNVEKIIHDLEKVGLNFSRDRYDGRDDLLSCMDVWLDDMFCAYNTCRKYCWIKFLDPHNRVEDDDENGLQKKCIECDEQYCGPQFIKGAGANRRSSGIESDIRREEREKCTSGLYSGVPESELPTEPNPLAETHTKGKDGEFFWGAEA